MNAFILIVLLLFPSGARALCLPSTGSTPELKTMDSDLEVTAEDFKDFAAGLLPQDQVLVLHFDSLNPRTNADVEVGAANEVKITVYGGMLRRKEMRKESLVLLLCHELGHFLGGAPLKSRGGWSSTEGQADYYSSKVCARRWGLGEGEFLDGALSLTAIYAAVTGERAPALESCDNKVVERTNFGYPSTQCRLDTMIAGWRGDQRPFCWYRD